MLQDGSSAKRARLEGPTGLLSKVSASTGGAQGEATTDSRYDADGEQNGWGGGTGRQRRVLSGMSGPELVPGDAGTLGVPGEPHQRHHHHQHNLLGQVS